VPDDISKSIARHGSRIDRLLKEFIPRRRGDFISPAIWHHFEAKGKRIRPAMCLIACEALGGDPERAIHFALAVEILHNMLLLHDDLEDGDLMRRDKPTVWVRFGMPNAVNVGDYLLAKSYEAALASRVPSETKVELLRILNRTCLQTTRGQAMDINSRGAPDFTVRKYLSMARLKTGCYLACGMVGGAIVAGARQRVLDDLWKLGDTLGPAFQIRDDLIDLTVGKGRGGRLGCDIYEGKPSILYAYAIEGGRHAAELRRIMKKPRERTSRADVRRVIAIYEECGAIERAQAKAAELVQQALRIISRLPVKNKQAFVDLAHFMISRKT